MSETPSTSLRGRRGGMGSHSRPNQGETDEWYTPPGVFTALGLEFDLDPCHPEEKLPWVPAARTYCEAEDGLTTPWSGRVWMNPPYGRQTGIWMERFAEHGNGIALVFARTETDWFHRFALTLDAWLFIRGRLSFVDAQKRPGSSNAGAPSVLLAAGSECVDALKQSGLGICEKSQPAQASLFGEMA